MVGSVCNNKQSTNLTINLGMVYCLVEKTELLLFTTTQNLINSVRPRVYKVVLRDSEMLHGWWDLCVAIINQKKGALETYYTSMPIIGSDSTLFKHSWIQEGVQRVYCMLIDCLN